MSPLCHLQPAKMQDACGGNRIGSTYVMVAEAAVAILTAFPQIAVFPENPMMT